VSFLVDTNVVSEWVKPRPNPGVVSWLAGTNEDQVFLSVVTLAELRYGIERIASGRRQRQLSAWLENELPMRFEGRVLSIDAAVAHACGRLVAKSETTGRPVEAMDAFLAATAQVHQLTLVTRNISHFHSILKALLNPWI
jgi:toxin FitB